MNGAAVEDAASVAHTRALRLIGRKQGPRMKLDLSRRHGAVIIHDGNGTCLPNHMRVVLPWLILDGQNRNLPFPSSNLFGS